MERKYGFILCLCFTAGETSLNKIDHLEERDGVKYSGKKTGVPSNDDPKHRVKLEQLRDN